MLLKQQLPVQDPAVVIAPKTAATESQSWAASFHVGDAPKVAQEHKHHSNVKELWVSEWREHCQKSIYPFNHGGQVLDFEPIFKSMAEVHHFLTTSETIC